MFTDISLVVPKSSHLSRIVANYEEEAGRGRRPEVA
jgi:hypothetical protein